MKKLVILIAILIVLLTLGFFGFWAAVLKNSRRNLESEDSIEVNYIKR